MQSKKFLMTTDRDFAERLRGAGLIQVSEIGGQFIFINNGNVKFSENEKGKITYTNMLTI